MGERIFLRVSESEKATIAHNAALHSMTVSEYLRRRGLSVPIKSTQLAALRVEFASLVKALRETGTINTSDIQTLISELREVLEC